MGDVETSLCKGVVPLSPNPHFPNKGHGRRLHPGGFGLSTSHPFDFASLAKVFLLPRHFSIRASAHPRSPTPRLVRFLIWLVNCRAHTMEAFVADVWCNCRAIPAKPWPPLGRAPDQSKI